MKRTLAALTAVALLGLGGCTKNPPPNGTVHKADYSRSPGPQPGREFPSEGAR